MVAKLQKCVILFTIVAEYIAAIDATKEILWLKRFLQDFGLKQNGYIVNYNSQGSLDLNNNVIYHSWMKHIDMRYHWLQQELAEQLTLLEKIYM